MKWFVVTVAQGVVRYVQAADAAQAKNVANEWAQKNGYGSSIMGNPMEVEDFEQYKQGDPNWGSKVISAEGKGGEGYGGGGNLPPGSTSPFTTSGDGNEYIGEETALGRRAGFQRALAARGRPTGGFAGEYYQDQYDPYESAFQGELATNIGGIGSQHDPQVGNQQLFSKYIGQNDNPYGAILNQFRTLQGLGAGGSNEFANRLTTPDESSLADSQGFFQNALRARLGGYAASLLSPSLGRASVGYAGQPVATNGAPNQQQNYLEFMRQRLGLGGVNF